jgi:hypothetical protein
MSRLSHGSIRQMRQTANIVPAYSYFGKLLQLGYVVKLERPRRNAGCSPFLSLHVYREREDICTLSAFIVIAGTM